MSFARGRTCRALPTCETVDPRESLGRESTPDSRKLPEVPELSWKLASGQQEFQKLRRKRKLSERSAAVSAPEGVRARQQLIPHCVTGRRRTPYHSSSSPSSRTHSSILRCLQSLHFSPWSVRCLRSGAHLTGTGGRTTCSLLASPRPKISGTPFVPFRSNPPSHGTISDPKIIVPSRWSCLCGKFRQQSGAQSPRPLSLPENTRWSETHSYPAASS